ncbi:hypothetical protein GW766_01325 [Candidatus Parcubacteria bacterium]|nr:hypothetical protein [Candidatus Parcubacteria bacterium]
MNFFKSLTFIRTSSPLLAIFLLVSPKISSAAGLSFNVQSRLNPGITTAEGLLSAILNIFIVIATPIIVLFIIYAGFLYVTARGNAEQVQQATRALTYAIIGAVLVLGSVALAQIIKGVVVSFS